MALAWVLKDPRITSVLIGASSVSQLENNLAALASAPFAQDELLTIDTILKEEHS
jgi:L-glyceraldehyde 3-phosphate reductase